MRMTQLLFCLPVATALLYACGGEDPIHADATVVLEGAVTDEALTGFSSALAQTTPRSVPTKAATLDTPASGALPKATVPTFTWHIGAEESHLDAPSHDEGTPPSFLRWASLPRADAAHGFVAPLRTLLGPIRSARAHGTPFTGVATYLVFATASQPNLVRVLTSELSYSPSKEAWATMTGASEPITLTLTSADMEENRVITGGGPFAGTVTTFTITP